MLHRIDAKLTTTFCLAALIAVPVSHSQDRSKIQLPADQRALAAARAIPDQEQRLAAMMQAIEANPRSPSAFFARKYVFDTLVQYFPDRTSVIETQTRLILKNDDGYLPIPFLEVYMASRLAEAKGIGINLPLAEEMAKDAIASYSNEDDFIKDAVENARKINEPSPITSLLHSDFAADRAGALSTLAQIYIDQHLLKSAAVQIYEAYSLAPTMSEVNVVYAELALKQHKNREALKYFERAELSGEVKSPWHEKMMELYRNSHGGSDQNFVADMDVRYKQLFPEPFTPHPHKPLDTHRTALLELFTGSACKPCVAADLALDALLETYSRNDLVVLAFDLHIPDPDPLANSDSVARATYYGIHHTPSFVLNGRPFLDEGGSRDYTEKSYNNAVKRIDAESVKPSGLGLQLTANRSSDGIIHANATLSVDDPEQLRQSLAPEAAVEPAGDESPTAPGPQRPTTVTSNTEPHLVTRMALVEDEVRYSGESGIRFHRMVVRALAHSSSESIAPGKTWEVVFDPSTISRELKDYLDNFEEKNDTFGKVKFLSKEATLDRNHLAIAAWVEDATTHRVLQAAFSSLTPVANPQSRSLEVHSPQKTGATR
ncbi:lipopolysaccharide assembly protein LapB [Granulicella sp. L60]|uniref:tetratricopeptide repeat protein n=1 Tax=Granulicella sp. L60 TaxID=1641866 RepID=UPI00131E1895|nr:hypothetical protein [Granulicella sp. L60]